MKLLKLLPACIVIATSYGSQAGQTVTSVGYGVEEIRNSTVKGDIYQSGIMHRLDNGIMLGTVLESIKPNISQVSDETRLSIVGGYSTKIDKFRPSIQVAYMHRDLKTGSDIDAYWIRPSVSFPIGDKLVGDISVRWRQSLDNSVYYKNRTHFFGLGYPITKDVSIQAQYGSTSGSYKSDSYAVMLVNKF